MGMKIDEGFIYILIIVEILVLLCALHQVSIVHVLFCNLFKSPVCKIL